MPRKGEKVRPVGTPLGRALVVIGKLYPQYHIVELSTNPNWVPRTRPGVEYNKENRNAH